MSRYPKFGRAKIDAYIILAIIIFAAVVMKDSLGPMLKVFGIGIVIAFIAGVIYKIVKMVKKE